METKQKYLRDIRDAINGVETSMPGVAGESEATYLRDIAKAIRSSGIDPSIPKVTDADNGKILKVINGVWAKGESSSGVLYGEETPASTLGKNGDVYVQYETRSEKEALIENQKIPDTNDYITDILAEDYEILTFYVYRYNQGTETEHDHYMVNVAISYLMEYGHVEILDTDDHVIANITITNDGYIKMINNSSLLEYYLVFSIYEPVVEPNSITDIYLKVDGEWIKDEYGGSDQLMFIHGTVPASSNVVTLDKTHAEIYDFVKDGDKTAIIILQYRGSVYVPTIVPLYFVLTSISPLSPYALTFTYVGKELSKRSDNKTYGFRNLEISLAPDVCMVYDNYATLHLGFEIEGVLEAGETEITLSDNNITTSDTFDIYTSIWGAEPTDVTVASGSITLTFEEQETDMNVKVKVS